MWTDPNNILSAINIVVMGLFTFLVWRATKNGADAAKATYALNEKLVKLEENHTKALKDQYVNKVIVELQNVIAAVHQQTISLNTGIIRSHLNTRILTDEQLAKYFTLEERNIIEQPWAMYEEYLKDNWLTDSGEFYGVFGGNEVKRLQNESRDMERFLVECLEKIYKID